MQRLVLHALCALPLSWYVYAAFASQLGANPAEALIRGLGDWTIRLLLLTLAVTPLRTVFKRPQWIRYRRLFGLWTFAYATLHLLAYAGFDQGLDPAAILQDTLKRPFILVGMLAFALLLPLAATSFAAAQRALGGRRWQALHRSVYAVAVLACLHFFWMRSGKQLFTEPAIYAAGFALLLGWRVVNRISRRTPAPPRPSASSPR